MPKTIIERDVFVATLKHLTSKGYRSATVAAIAAEAGVNEATLFRKYKSKIGLLAAAAKWALAESPIAALTYTGDLEADLFNIAQAHIETARMHGPLMPVLMMELAHHAELRAPMAAAFQGMAQVTTIIIRHQSSGLLVQAPPQMLASAFVAPLLAPFVLGHALGNRDLAPVPDPEVHVKMFMHGYARPENA